MKINVNVFVVAIILFQMISNNAAANLRSYIGNTWLKACLFDTQIECEENDCVWKDRCVLPDLSGRFCLNLEQHACEELHVCRWSGKKCVGKTPCAVTCESFETPERCRPGQCVWDAVGANCVSTRKLSSPESKLEVHEVNPDAGSDKTAEQALTSAAIFIADAPFSLWGFTKVSIAVMGSAFLALDAILEFLAHIERAYWVQ